MPFVQPVIAFEDSALVVVVKPTGLPAQPDPSRAFSLLDWAQQYWKQACVINRLDRPAGGLMLLAKTPAAAAQVNKLLQTGQIEKTYLVLAENGSQRLKTSAFLENYLLKYGCTNLSKVVEAGTAGAKVARLHYKILAVGKTRTLLEIRLETGRHHQIRAQFSHLGCPVAGDVKYRARRALRQGGIALWSYKLSFFWKGRERKFICYPSGPAWRPFLDMIGISSAQACIQKLSANVEAPMGTAEERK
ncbi:MAG: RluA family pseudouridine synthase [Candidatus Bruticola sp.]